MEIIGGRYRIEHLAGQGGFGSVYRGYDEQMERSVAIKITESVGEREALVMRNLDHRGLPRLLDICEYKDQKCLIMEWIEGIDLERYIKTHGPMSEKKAIKTGKEILEVLKYLHNLKPALIYQDLKPSNIMLMPDGHIKLIDFGTALFMEYAGEEMMTAGTAGYGAPEQKGITGHRHAGVRSDIYSWGAVMYSCLSGRMLNKPPYTMEKIRLVVPRISYGLAHVISKCVNRNESERYSGAEEVLRALNKRGYTDTLYKVLFSAFMALCIFPFIYAWLKAYSDGVFGLIQTVLYGIATRRGQEGYENLIGPSSLRDIGLLISCGAWMILGIRSIKPRRFIRIRKSIFLSSHRFPGLWMGALLSGIIFGMGVGGFITPSVSYAEEKNTGILGEDEPLFLPLSILDENGNRMLLKSNSEYVSDGDVRFVIDAQSIGNSDGVLRIDYISAEGNETLRRTIPVRFD
ncbi:MAG: serine/threonine protein kinase [Lachnospiraceae bacterium]|nr:serine/threonine protein kinase [Lachnospiraceae bacterium]